MFPDFGSVGQVEKKKTKKNHKKSQNRRPGTPASLLWSLETTRHEHNIYMAEAFVAVIVKSRQYGGKDQPPKLLCNLPASLTFQQRFEKEGLPGYIKQKVMLHETIFTKMIFSPTQSCNIARLCWVKHHCCESSCVRSPLQICAG